jgi:hydroxymethylpyrimidine/phosphomethylpyrimidine kinase
MAVHKKAALTIAGSDSGGGAGIQADLKTFSAFGIFGTSVITAITAQNLSGVSGVQPVPPEMVKMQLIAVMEGFPITAIKTGMLFSKEIITIVAQVLTDFPSVPIVVDPVFISTSGHSLIEDEAIESLKRHLLPLAYLVTPNIPEAERILAEEIKSVTDSERAAQTLFKRFGVPFLVKGGHLADKPVDILYDGQSLTTFQSSRSYEVNSHGSGCTFASAITASLAAGQGLQNSISIAKKYISQALNTPLRLTDDTAVINHFWRKG